MRTISAQSLAPSTRPVWGAFWWSLAFGLASLYWAAGGTVGLSTLAEVLQEAAREGDTATRQATALAGLAKIAAGGLALLSLRPRGGRAVRRVQLSLLWGAAVLFTLYGPVGFLEKAFMAAGVLDPKGVGEDPLVWYLLLWEPAWLVGGVLFGLTARRYERITRTR